MRKNLFHTFSKWTLIFTLVVTFAGGFVRMTGSGMGCPDWPKCFGHYIPPTDASELIFQSNTHYNKRQMIIRSEQLLMAKESFTSSDQFDMSNWEVYEKHDYAEFNVAHTWTEYINRLAGAILGVLSLLMLIGAFMEKDRKWKKVRLSVFVVILIAFEAWLGMKVVETVLKPLIISLHMIGALIILAVLIWMRANYVARKLPKIPIPKNLFLYLWIVIAFSIIQILMGTQVREGLSLVAKQFEDRGQWFELLQGKTWLNSNISMIVLFYFHRSFSILVVLFNYLIYRKLRGQFRFSMLHQLNNWIMITIIIEIVTGAIMYYINVPGLMQLIHLVFSFFMFALQFYLVAALLRSRK